MDTVYSENNHIIMVGKVTSDKRFSHEIYGEKFYIFDLSVPRLSGNSDIIPITISERLMVNGELPIGTKITVEGQFRSYNSYGEGKNKLVLTVFAKNVTLLEDQESEVEARKDFISNEVTLIGYICKKPVYRQTPFGREIADILLAVNRAYSKSDYIPCIAWGRTARFCENMEVGTEVKLVGRVQSRQYEKKHEDGTVENKVAYEVSVGSLEVVNQKDDGEAEEAPVEEKMNMIDVFEEQFGRPLTPMEFDSIKEWVQSGYSEEMILKALKEAVKSNVSSLRYIEGILINWAQNGIKERYIEEKPKERVVPESHYHWWEDE